MIRAENCPKCGKLIKPVKSPGSRNSTRGWSWVLPIIDGMCEECLIKDFTEKHKLKFDSLSKSLGKK